MDEDGRSDDQKRRGPPVFKPPPEAKRFSRPSQSSEFTRSNTEPAPDAEERPLPRTTSRPPVNLPVLGRFAGYEIMGRLALGGMAEILLARHRDPTGDERYIVVKKILPHFENDNEFVQMFLDEARIGMLLNHHNITQFYQYGEADGAHFITMEWVNGVPLARLIRRSRREKGIPLPIALRIIADTAAALHHAHQVKDAHGDHLKLIHRDVSPHNIMVAYNGEAKLLDFGIAKAEQQAHRTQAGVVKGKFAYMSPEQCVGGDLDHRLDVFALGVCMYETVAGHSLYRRKTEAATMRAIIMDPVPSIRDRVPEIPAEIDAIISKALAKEPKDRYPTAGHLQQDIESYLESQGLNVKETDVATFVRKTFEEEYGVGPRVDTTPFADSYGATGSTGGDSGAAQYIVPLVSGTREIELEFEAPELDALMAPELAAPRAPSTTRSARPPSRRAAPPPKRNAARRRSPKPYVAFGVAILAAIAAVGFLFYSIRADKTETPNVVTPVVTTTESGFTNKIHIVSAPSGATVYINNKLYGNTPISVEGVAPGAYDVRVHFPGFAEWSKSIQLQDDSVEGILARLMPKQGGGLAGASGYLSLRTEPPTVVYLSGDRLGQTPLDRIVVPTGRLTLELQSPDGTSTARPVFVKPDKETHARFDIDGDVDGTK